jgi:uncharacterized YccA/Bax inhibitor family protein
MALTMRGSPVLNEDRFGPAARQGGSAAPMTINGTVTATCVMLVLLLASATVGWLQVTTVEQYDRFGRVINASVSDIPAWVFVGALLGFVLFLVTVFVPKIAMITAPLYALAYGGFVGALSHVYNASYDGIVTQALFATLSIFTVMLLLYATRIIKVTNRFVMVVAGATMGIVFMYLGAFVVSLFGGDVSFLSDGSPLAIGISAVIIIVGALRLAVDFAFIESAARNDVPKYLEWYAAFGLVVTLLWIYLEVLRLLAMLNRR